MIESAHRTCPMCGRKGTRGFALMLGIVRCSNSKPCRDRRAKQIFNGVHKFNDKN